ncbi:ABC transporter family protein, partial [Vibrio parahaemolyticus V-223/04]
NSA